MRCFQVLMFSVLLPVQAALGCQDYTFEGWTQRVQEASPLFIGTVTKITPRTDGPEGTGDVTIRVEQIVRGVVENYYSVEQPALYGCVPRYSVGDRVIMPADDPTYPGVVILSNPPTLYERAQLDFVQHMSK